MEQLLSKIQVTVKLFLTAFLILTINLSAHSKTPKWYLKLKQVKLMVTTKQEVEKLFNYPEATNTFDGEWSKNIDYNLKEGKLSVSYSQGKCSEVNTDGYNVEKDVVIGITMYLEEEVSISKLALDLSNFDKREISDLVGVFTYVNENSGEWFNGTSRKLNDFKLFPSKSKEHLKCKNHK